jgi:hypothetical protein
VADETTNISAGDPSDLPPAAKPARSGGRAARAGKPAADLPAVGEVVAAVPGDAVATGGASGLKKYACTVPKSRCKAFEEPTVVAAVSEADARQVYMDHMGIVALEGGLKVVAQEVS